MNRALTRLGLATVLVAGLAAPVLGDSASVRDPKDADIATLDVKRAGHGHARAGRILRHEVTMYRSWTKRDLAHAQVWIWLHDGDEAPDRTFSVWVQEGEFRSVMRRGEYGQKIGLGKAYKSDSRTLVMAFRRKLLGDARAWYRWRAVAQARCDSSGEPDGPICMPPRPDKTESLRHTL